ncbi:MAG: 8-oxo-dGTP diphosphatase [Vicingaceae bacterium]|jgi:8-oxo-dGTP diphosphatase
MFEFEHFFRGAYSVNIGVITFKSGKLSILLQQKEDYPSQNEIGLPGKIILPNEETEIALEKLMINLLGRNDFYRKQLDAFTAVNRHPLGRVVCFAYYGLIPFENIDETLLKNLHWEPLNKIPKLCYDHDEIVKMILHRFRKGLLRHPRVFEFLPTKFTIMDVIKIYEQAFSTKIDASNFGKQVLKSNLVTPNGEYRKDAGRPAKLYEFNKSAYIKEPKNKMSFNF